MAFNYAVVNLSTVDRLVRRLGQASSPLLPLNLAAIRASIYHTIHTLTLILTLNITLTINLTLISSYLTNKHQYTKPSMSTNWMTSRLRDQSAARCKNCVWDAAAIQHWYNAAVSRAAEGTQCSCQGGVQAKGRGRTARGIPTRQRGFIKRTAEW